MLKTVYIDEIKITDRIRKDYGDIQELADDIKKSGLINPPVVTTDLILIAGERRIKACKLLGYRQIEVKVMTRLETTNTSSGWKSPRTRTAKNSRFRKGWSGRVGWSRWKS